MRKKSALGLISALLICTLQAAVAFGEDGNSVKAAPKPLPVGASCRKVQVSGRILVGDGILIADRHDI